MKDSKDLFPQVTPEDENEVILLTKVSNSAVSLPAAQESSSTSAHTLDAAPFDLALPAEKDWFTLEKQKEDPVLVLNKPVETHTLEEPPQPLFVMGTPEETLFPEIVLPTEPPRQEEEFLQEMSQELFAAGHIEHPLESTEETNEVQEQPLLPSASSPSNEMALATTPASLISQDDLPWGMSEQRNTEKEQQNLFISLQTKEEANELTSIEPAQELREDIALFDLEPSLEQLEEEAIEQQFELLAPIDSPKKETSVASTHVDLEFSENIFLQGILDELLKECGRACIFSHQASLLHGLQAKGPGNIAQKIHSILFPTTISPTLTQVIESQRLYVGSLPENASDRMFAACLSQTLPTQIAIYPIVQKEQVVAIYVLDNTDKETFLGMSERIDNLIRRATELDYTWHAPDLMALLTPNK